MIKQVNGDILDYNEGIICHQTNYLGVMGGGIALAIRQKLLTPDQYKCYKDECRTYGACLLGSATFYVCGSRLTVANCYCQNGAPDMFGSLTNYAAMDLCFQQVVHNMRARNLPVLIPGYMGCGIARGDWNTVRGIIERNFADDESLDCTIVYKKQEV